MAKFTFLFVAILCLIQSGYVSSNDTVPEVDIQKVIQLVENLGTEIQQILSGLSDRLPEIVTTFETNIKLSIEKSEIPRIFEAAKNEINVLVTDDSSNSLQCSQMALEELDNLNQKTSSDIVACVAESRLKSGDINNKAQELIQKASGLAQDVTTQVDKCAKSNNKNANELAKCLENEMTDIRNFLEKLKGAINETVDTTEKIAQASVTEVEVCLRILEEDTQDNINHVVEELKTCIHEL